MQLTRQEIFDRLKELFMAVDGSDDLKKVTEDSRLTDDLGFNSVNILYIVISVEEEFGVEFDDVGINSFVTIGDVIDYIEVKLK